MELLYKLLPFAYYKKIKVKTLNPTEIRNSEVQIMSLIWNQNENKISGRKFSEEFEKTSSRKTEAGNWNTITTTTRMTFSIGQDL